MNFAVEVNGITLPHGHQDTETRLELLRKFTGGNEPTQFDANTVQRFIKALAETVGSRRKSVLPGLGVFEWRRYRHRTPDGKMPKNAYRLSFTLTRSRRKYKGDNKNGNR